MYWSLLRSVQTLGCLLGSWVDWREHLDTSDFSHTVALIKTHARLIFIGFSYLDADINSLVKSVLALLQRRVCHMEVQTCMCSVVPSCFGPHCVYYYCIHVLLLYTLS